MGKPFFVTSLVFFKALSSFSTVLLCASDTMSVQEIQDLITSTGIDGTDTAQVIAFTIGVLKGAASGQPDSAAAKASAASDVDSRRYGFIGVGTINSAVIRGLVSADIKLAPRTITLSPRNAARAAALAKELPNNVAKVASTNQEVIDASDYVFVATPPGTENARQCLSGLHFRPEQVVISIIAGVSADVLKEVCDCPTIVQALPLPPAENHVSTTVQWPEHKGVAEVFKRLGSVVEVPDARKATAVASISCIMGDFYARLRASHEWLVSQGVDPTAASEAVRRRLRCHISHQTLVAMLLPSRSLPLTSHFVVRTML